MNPSTAGTTGKRTGNRRRWPCSHLRRTSGRAIASTAALRHVMRRSSRLAESGGFPPHPELPIRHGPVVGRWAALCRETPQSRRPSRILRKAASLKHGPWGTYSRQAFNRQGGLPIGRTPGRRRFLLWSRFPRVRRESLRCQQRAVPPLIGPWNGYRDIVQQHRRPGTVGTLTGMLAHAGRSGDPGPNGRAVCSRVAIERRDPTPPVRTDPTGSRPSHRIGGCLARHERWSHPIVTHAVPAPSWPKPPLSCPGGGRSNPGMCWMICPCGIPSWRAVSGRSCSGQTPPRRGFWPRPWRMGSNRWVVSCEKPGITAHDPDCAAALLTNGWRRARDY